MTKKIESICILLIFLIGTMLLSTKAPEQGALVDKNEKESVESTHEKEYPRIQMKERQTKETVPDFEQQLKIEHEEWERLKEQKGCYEVCKYVNLNADEFMDEVGNCLNMKREGNIITGYKVKFYFNESEMEKVTLEYDLEFPDNMREMYVWSIMGISLYENINKIKNKILSGSDYSCLQVGSHVLTGIELQKKGIEYVYICGDSEAIIVSSEIHKPYIEKLKNMNFSWKEKNFTYSDRERNVDIQIKYPELEISNNPEIAERINQNIIESAFLELPETIEIETVENLILKEHYTIMNVSADFVSVRFDGQKEIEGKETSFAAGSTSSVLEHGKKLKLKDAVDNVKQIEMIEEDILLDEEFTYEEKEQRLLELRDSYVNYVITPGFIDYFYPPSQFSEGKCVVLSVMRENRIISY